MNSYTLRLVMLIWAFSANCACVRACVCVCVLDTKHTSRQQSRLHVAEISKWRYHDDLCLLCYCCRLSPSGSKNVHCSLCICNRCLTAFYQDLHCLQLIQQYTYTGSQTDLVKFKDTVVGLRAGFEGPGRYRHPLPPPRPPPPPPPHTHPSCLHWLIMSFPWDIIDKFGTPYVI